MGGRPARGVKSGGKETMWRKGKGAKARGQTQSNLEKDSENAGRTGARRTLKKRKNLPRANWYRVKTLS